MPLVDPQLLNVLFRDGDTQGEAIARLGRARET